MRYTLIFATLLVLLCGCGKKNDPEQASKPDPVAAKGTENSAPLTTGIASREQIGASVRVRVIAGGLPVKNVTGAILHRDEVRDAGAYFESNRCVLALLSGWSEEQLRSKQTKYVIFRNLPDDHGELRAKSYPGKLLQFDAASGIATIAYAQGFSSLTDLGFKINRSALPAGGAVALRFASPEAAPFVPGLPGDSQARVYPALQVASGAFSVAPNGTAALRFPAPDPASSEDESALVTTAPGFLHGFARETGSGTAVLAGIPPLTVTVEVPEIIPLSASFQSTQGILAASIEFETRNNDDKIEKGVLRKAKLSPGTKFDLVAFIPPFQPIISTESDEAVTLDYKLNRFRARFAIPDKEDEEVAYVLQLAWKASRDEALPSMFSRPFVVKFRQNSGQVIVKTEGISYPDQIPDAPKIKGESFPVEAPVIRIFEIAGGREVLMQLEGEPYWKRFSMEKKEWLPLPPVNLSTVDLAGNLTSLFVLDRAARQVLRYELADLKPAGSVRIQIAEAELFSVRAGCNTQHAPIHLLSSHGRFSFDPDTLQRTDIPENQNRTPHSASSAPYFHATGDGITLVDTVNFHESFSYRGHILGLKWGYFGVVPRARKSGPMVSAAFDVDQGAVSSCAAPEGVWTEVVSRSPSNEFIRTFVFPNAPVVGRILPGNERSIPPKHPRLQLTYLLHDKPFGEITIPELIDIRDGRGELPGKTTLVSVDLQSRRVGIFAPKEKAWVVRDIELNAEFKEPGLLNWPDTSIPRGGEWRFEPHLAGEGTWSAELVGAKEATPVGLDEKGITFRVAPNEIASLLLLKLTISNPQSVSKKAMY